VDVDPAEEDDDFEVDLEAVVDVSFALAVFSLGFKALVSGSISDGNGSGIAWALDVPFLILRCLVSEGAYAVSTRPDCNKK